MSDFTTLWDDAGGSAEQEIAERSMRRAVAQLNPIGEFIFQASDEHDLDNRLALADDRFVTASVDHGVDREQLVDHFRRQASLVLEAKRVTAKFEVGDWVQKDGEDHVRKITRITPAGSAGTSHANGPTYHASIIHEDGKVGHTADVWSKSMSNPTSAYKKVDGPAKRASMPKQASGESSEYSQQYLSGYHTGHSDVMRRRRPDGVKWKHDNPGNPFLHGTDSHAGYRQGRYDALSGFLPLVPHPSEEPEDWHDDDDPSLLGPLGREGSKSDARLAAIKRALEEGVDPLSWLPAEDGGEGEGEVPSISGNEAFIEGDYVGGGSGPKEASSKQAAKFGERDACSKCGQDVEYVGSRPDKDKEFLHVDRGDGWWDRGGNFSCSEGGTHTRGGGSKQGSRKAAQSLAVGDVISERAVFRGEPLRRQAMVAQVSQDAIEPGWVRINTQDGRVLRTPKIASVVLAPKA